MTIEEKCLEVSESNLSKELKLELIGLLVSKTNNIPYQITYYPTRTLEYETDTAWWKKITCSDKIVDIIKSDNNVIY